MNFVEYSAGYVPCGARVRFLVRRNRLCRVPRARPWAAQVKGRHEGGTRHHESNPAAMRVSAYLSERLSPGTVLNHTRTSNVVILLRHNLLPSLNQNNRISSEHFELLFGGQLGRNTCNCFSEGSAHRLWQHVVKLNVASDVSTASSHSATSRRHEPVNRLQHKPIDRSTAPAGRAVILLL